MRKAGLSVVVTVLTLGAALLLALTPMTSVVVALTAGYCEAGITAEVSVPLLTV